MDKLTRAVVAGVVLLGLAVAVGGPPGPDVPPPPPLSPPAAGIPITRPPDPAAAKLDVVLRQVQIDRTPLARALEAIARQAGTNVVVTLDAHVDRHRPVDVSLTDVTARDALSAALLAAGAQPGGFRIVPHGALVVIGDPPLMREYGGEVRVYDVADILINERRRMLALTKPAAGEPAASPAAAQPPAAFGEDPAAYVARENLIRFITMYADEGGWIDVGGNGVGRIGEYNGRLIITQTPAAHQHVEAVLAMLRRTGTIPATGPTTAPAASDKDPARPPSGG